MADRKYPQKPQNKQLYQPKQQTEQKIAREVRQDGYASRPVGVASTHAVRAGEVVRTRQLLSISERSKNYTLSVFASE
ncbi:MAG: hypothetical protein JO266_09905 [Acidobacteria bacterium]|nr:hypothetical protein [Acidobacteriota bacterium]MBV9482276.1 hypothetical protein [Acidobacteriota bacterium]